MGTGVLDPPKSGVSELIVKYGNTHVGHKVPHTRGECWDLPNEALRFAKAKTPSELGQGLYVWGNEVSLDDAQPGDILQFDRVKVKRSWVLPDGRAAREELNFGRRHSAIIERVEPGRKFTTLNLHVNRKVTVQRIVMYLSTENIAQGEIHVYRPVPGGTAK
jgi:hypothetical protein